MITTARCSLTCRDGLSCWRTDGRERRSKKKRWQSNQTRATGCTKSCETGGETEGARCLGAQQKLREFETNTLRERFGNRDQQLGDCLGKGAFGSVYRALNWGTGETVAVKQIKLADLPKSELRVIMVWHIAITDE